MRTSMSFDPFGVAAERQREVLDADLAATFSGRHARPDSAMRRSNGEVARARSAAAASQPAARERGTVGGGIAARVADSRRTVVRPLRVDERSRTGRRLASPLERGLLATARSCAHFVGRHAPRAEFVMSQYPCMSGICYQVASREHLA